MKQFISFVRKEFYHIFRDKRTMLILLGLPVVQILLFGFALTNEVKDVQVAVYDPSKDEVTRQIVEKFRTSPYFVLDDELAEVDDINEVFKYGRISLVIVFSENFAENLLHTGEASVQLVTDGTEPNQASMITAYASNILALYQQSLAEQGRLPFRIMPEIKMLFNPQSESAYNFVPGVMGMILMLICAMMTSIAIVREKETGTMEVSLVSPVRPIYIILSKMTPYFVLSCVNLVTILLLAIFVLRVPVHGSMAALISISLLYIFTSLALGLLISTVSDRQVIAMMVSALMLMVPTMLLSGMLFPIESLPPILKVLSNILPATWYISAARKLMIAGLPAVSALKETLVLAGMAVFLLMVSMKKFKNRLE